MQLDVSFPFLVVCASVSFPSKRGRGGDLVLSICLELTAMPCSRLCHTCEYWNIVLCIHCVLHVPLADWLLPNIPFPCCCNSNVHAAKWNEHFPFLLIILDFWECIGCGICNTDVWLVLSPTCGNEWHCPCLSSESLRHAENISCKKKNREKIKIIFKLNMLRTLCDATCP